LTVKDLAKQLAKGGAGVALGIVDPTGVGAMLCATRSP
jgi:hypothetical protein